jgi:hypothetical protein
MIVKAVKTAALAFVCPADANRIRYFACTAQSHRSIVTHQHAAAAAHSIANAASLGNLGPASTLRECRIHCALVWLATLLESCSVRCTIRIL